MFVEPSRDDLERLVVHQVNSLFIAENAERAAIHELLDDVLEQTHECFSAWENKYFRRGGRVRFSIFHSDQYCVFLYLLSRRVFLHDTQNVQLADKLYYLNKSLNGIDLFYEVEMPSHFTVGHPVGTVLGRAQYGDYFSVSQCCTVGNNKDVYPTLGTNVTMMSGAKILGNCRIGDNVVLAANSYVKDEHVPTNSLVFGASPELVVKPRTDLG